ncbi:hypothetical protein HAX54_037047 [Datura stramonium]|uniref:Uncharacterized protein n=1 Tax=Datura stramonium TaxID=4076 RepID=A0ABS8VHR2_DATST|nr:hypothetical protein [Datura stramonium]
MPRTRNSENNAPATAAVGSSIEEGITKKVVMPSEMGEAFNAVKGAMEMFTAFMANQSRGEIKLHHTQGEEMVLCLQGLRSSLTWILQSFVRPSLRNIQYCG